jgi:hypothetical protein
VGGNCLRGDRPVYDEFTAHHDYDLWLGQLMPMLEKPEAEVLAALEAAGLECLDVFGHHHDSIPHHPLDEVEHTKGVYIARATEAAR